jgi:glucosyl-3-phosphoglycerate phosphatase
MTAASGDGGAAAPSGDGGSAARSGDRGSATPSGDGGGAGVGAQGPSWPVRERRLLLLRHGRTAWNAERRFQGHADPPLDDVGRAQAYEVAALMAMLRPDLVVSSDAARAVQTAEPISAALRLEIRADARLRERSLGHWEGLTRDEVRDRYPDEYADWIAGRDVSRRGGESRDEVASRALSAFRDLPAVDTTVLVTHSATAMALCAALLGLGHDVHVLGPLANCHWTELSAEQHDGATPFWRLRAHNVGAPGTVVPLPLYPSGRADDAVDADA